MKKPFIAIGQPIGQEAGNYDFITRNRIGKHFRSPRQFRDFLIEYINGRKDLDLKRLNRLCEIQQKSPLKIRNALKPFLN